MSKRNNKKHGTRGFGLLLAVLTVLLLLVCAALVYLRLFAIPAAGEQESAPPAATTAEPLAQAAETAAPAEAPAPTAEPEITAVPTEEPAATPEPTAEPAVQTVTLKAAQPGDTVSFGNYDGGEIYWLVLSAEDGKLTLLSREILECLPYCDTFSESTWAKCSLRSRLNSDFLSAAFSQTELAALSTMACSTGVNKSHYMFEGTTYASADTEDLVTLLSMEEAQQYAAAGVSLAAVMGDTAAEASNAEYSGCWWLRSPGRNMSHAVYVDAAGTVITSGAYTSCPYMGIRPVICVDTALLAG